MLYTYVESIRAVGREGALRSEELTSRLLSVPGLHVHGVEPGTPGHQDRYSAACLHRVVRGRDVEGRYCPLGLHVLQRVGVTTARHHVLTDQDTQVLRDVVPRGFIEVRAVIRHATGRSRA